MATERVTQRPDGTTERVVERDGGGATYVDRGGSGVGGVIIGIAVLALVAIVAFFLVTQTRNDNLRTSAVTGAAHSVGSAADSVGSAATRAADSAGGAASSAADNAGQAASGAASQTNPNP
jgi:hypothetical protein